MPTNLRSQFSDFFGPGKLPQLEAIILAKYDSYQSMIPILLNQTDMTTDIYQTTTYSGLQNPVPKAENSPVKFQTLKGGFKKTYTATTYASGYRISWEMKEDGKWDFIGRATNSFSKGNFEIRELKAAEIYDDGFNVNGYDGQPLFSDSHPLENGSGQLGVNTAVAAELSITSFRELRNIMQSTLNENGQLVKYMPSMFVVPQALQDDAAEIIKSQYNPENANNAINTVFNMVQLLPGGFWNYLESDTAYFLQADKADHYLMFMERHPLDITTDYDSHTFAHEIIARTRFDQGFSSWRGVVGNPGQ